MKTITEKEIKNMALKSSQNRVSFEERVDQDGRLTGKHIKTLLHLQDIDAENERLKARVAELELHEAKADRIELMEKELDYLRVELLKCQDIHAFAADAKEKLQKMQKNCLAKIDSSNRILTEKHKDEIMRVVSEKLEEENAWANERKSLQEVIKELELKNKSLTDKMKDLSSIQGEKADVASKLHESNTTINSLNKENKQLKEAIVALQKGIGELTCENDSLRKALHELDTKTKILTLQAKQAREKSDQSLPRETQTDQTSEVHQDLHERILKLEKENNSLQEDIKNKNKLVGTLEFNLQDSTQTLKLLYKERDLLKNRITGLLDEIAALKYQKPEPKQTFTEFVQLKRDFTKLHDEHEKLLKKRGSKPNILPCLTADSKTVSRSYSGGSIRSKNSTSS